MKKRNILIAVALLAVGFATVSTTLYLNGVINFGVNTDDFDVYFSKATVNGTVDNSVITDDTHIMFAKEMTKVGETYTLEYDVTNGSKNYDASLTMNCTGSSEYLSVNNSFDTTTDLPATETRTGTLMVELVKSYTGTSEDVSISCEISANAVERTTLATGTPADKVQQGVSLYNLMATNVSNDTVNFSVNSMNDGLNGIYTTTENGKPVYYYRGSYTALNNNLIFNNMCWKIIRTTETGGVKLIYNGTPDNGQCTTQTGDSTQIGTSEFNDNYNDNAYVGYMFGTAGSSTYEATHANINDSTIKTFIDNWYTTNFDAETTAKLEDTVFCNDRSTVKGGNNNTLSSTDYGTLGYGTNVTGYGVIARASYFTSTPSPSLECTNANDKFTVNSSNGNGKLTNPVGLITADEVILAGFNTKASNKSNYINTTNYLYTNSQYWSFTPAYMYTNGSARVSFVDKSIVNELHVGFTSGVRPVVSLTSGTTVTGDGSTTNPYVVQ